MAVSLTLTLHTLQDLEVYHMSIQTEIFSIFFSLSFPAINVRIKILLPKTS